MQQADGDRAKTNDRAILQKNGDCA